jgi:DNA-binding MarR family transcriptional regulator
LVFSWTYDRLRALEAELLAGFELTAQQYNHLRLLRASHLDPVPTLGLAARLVSRASDVTRMLDRREQRERVARSRCGEDRWAVPVVVTESGLALLTRIAEPLREWHEQQLGHLSSSDLRDLVQLLQKAPAPHEPPDCPWK